MPTAITARCVTGSDGRVYAFGERPEQAFAYDLGSKSWTTLPKVPHDRAYANQYGQEYHLPSGLAVAPDGKIWVTGQSSSNVPIDVYDPKTNTWTDGLKGPAYPRGRGLFVGSTLHVVDRADGSAAYAVDLATGSLSAPVRPALVSEEGSVLAAVANGFFYAIGGVTYGHQCNPFCFRYHPWVARYDPTTRSWTALADIPFAGGAIAASEGPDGLVYAFGGHGLDTPRNRTVFKYDPATNAWAAHATAFPVDRTRACATLAPDGRILVLGGYPATNEVLAFTP